METDKPEMRMVRTDDLVPYLRNPNSHPERQIEDLMDGIRQFRWMVPITATSDNEVIAGHGRLIAAQRLGIEEVPVFIRDHLSEEEKRAFRISDKRIAELADWDLAKLRSELDGISIDIPGFTAEELARLGPLNLDAPPISDDDIDKTRGQVKRRRYEGSRTGQYDTACPECGHEFTVTP